MKKIIFNTLALLLVIVAITFNSCKQAEETEPEKDQPDVSFTRYDYQ